MVLRRAWGDHDADGDAGDHDDFYHMADKEHGNGDGRPSYFELVIAGWSVTGVPLVLVAGLLECLLVVTSVSAGYQVAAMIDLTEVSLGPGR